MNRNINISRTITAKEANKLTPQYYWSKMKAACIYYGITQKELSGALGISEQTICKYNRSAEHIQLETVCRFCKAYKIGSIAELEKF